MIVSDAARLLFVHVPRTGGSSVAELLHRELPDARAVGFQHATLQGLGAEPAERYAGYFIFAFVRNPWERWLSWYSLLRGYNVTGLDPFPSFEAFLDDYDRQRRRIGCDASFLGNQSDYFPLADGADSPPVAVGRFERFEEELSRLLAPRLPGLGAIPHINQSTRPAYRDAYTPHARARVEELSRRDIERFDYHF